MSREGFGGFISLCSFSSHCNTEAVLWAKKGQDGSLWSHPLEQLPSKLRFPCVPCFISVLPWWPWRGFLWLSLTVCNFYGARVYSESLLNSRAYDFFINLVTCWRTLFEMCPSLFAKTISAVINCLLESGVSFPNLMSRLINERFFKSSGDHLDFEPRKISVPY